MNRKLLMEMGEEEDEGFERMEAMEAKRMSDTPRTDSYRDSIHTEEIVKHPLREFMDALEFARQLERELSIAKSFLADAMDHHTTYRWTKHGMSEFEGPPEDGCYLWIKLP